MRLRLAPLLLISSLPLHGGTIEGLVQYESPPDAEGRLRIRCVGETGAKKQATEFAPSPALVFLEEVQGSFPPPTAHATMAQRGLTFLPHVLPIVVGTTVDFPNEDDLQHNVFSYSPTRRFDLGRYVTGDSRPVTFDRVGLVRVCCEIHSHMKGFILVLQNPYFAFAGADGRYRMEGVPAGTYRVSVWHEDYKLLASTVEVTEDEPARSDFSLTRAPASPSPEAPPADSCGCGDGGRAASLPLVRIEPLMGARIGGGHAILLPSAGLVTANDGGAAAPEEETSILTAEEDTGFLGLEGLDLTLRSRDRLFEMAFSGRLDVIVHGIPADGAGLLGHDHTFVHDRADLFVDLWVGDVLYAFADGRTDRGENPSDDSQVARMERYFLRLSLPGDFDLSVQVGKFAGVIGNYLPRHEGPQDNFVRYPIVYDHPTWMDWQNPPTSNDGQIGHADFPRHADVGLPVIWQSYYATGGALFGSWEFLNWRFAAMNTAPSDRPESWGLDADGHSDKVNFMGRLGVVPLFGLEAGLNASRGPYLDEDAEARLDGKDRDEFDQILYGLDLAYSIGDLDLYLEVYRNEWEAHNIDGDLIVWAGYLEAKYTFVPGFYGAVRVGREQFSKIENSVGEDKTWDGNYTRYEIGAGYWIRSNLVIRGQVEFNQTERGRDLDDNVYSLGVGLSF